ncbi:signal peptidase [Chryseobacterium indologenes]|uniref:signal peptidase n=1 Tax=Chryseobacterium TaxID=59732 RepID=UPI0016240830|nr:MULTISPECIES: signal peptidase [Chryseobacterium]MDM1557400.1 signal peptidase [Chryseobacterium indologenes]WET48665.1 signal peptidase [Chryseobacterium indologenes]
MKAINKLVSALLLFVVSFAYAEEIPPAPTSTARGGIGGVGPGAPASPIDMYVYLLAAVAIVFIAFYTKKYKSIKA